MVLHMRVEIIVFVYALSDLELGHRIKVMNIESSVVKLGFSPCGQKVIHMVLLCCHKNILFLIINLSNDFKSH